MNDKLHNLKRKYNTIINGSISYLNSRNMFNKCFDILVEFSKDEYRSTFSFTYGFNEDGEMLFIIPDNTIEIRYNVDLIVLLNDEIVLQCGDIKESPLSVSDESSVITSVEIFINGDWVEAIAAYHQKFIQDERDEFEINELIKKLEKFKLY